MKKVSPRVGNGLVLAAGLLVGFYAGTRDSGNSGTANAAAQPASTATKSDMLELSTAQLQAIGMGVTSRHVFVGGRAAVGSINFNENLTVPVSSTYQGKIIKAYAEVGDLVKEGQPLYTIDSPDLVQAESTLIAAAGVHSLTSAALARAKALFDVQGLAQKDLDQAISDQQTAEAALKGDRDALRVFGKSDSEMDVIVAKRRIDSSLVVPSPISGRVTLRSAQPGLLVQPGTTPAPYTVADVSTVWLQANVTETDSPSLRVGQTVKVKVDAYPGREFEGHVSVLGESVDPVTHTLLMRSEMRDPRHELRPGMLASYDIRTEMPVESLAVPMDAVVREGDGSMSVWVTTDRKHFVKRTVKLGLEQDGLHQILEGLNPGDIVVEKGAILLSNMLSGDTTS